MPRPARTAANTPRSANTATTAETCVAWRTASRIGEAPRARYSVTNPARRITVSRSMRNSAANAPAVNAPSTTADS